MSDNSTIEWTDATWNPVRGCTEISAGCAHCYAKTFAERFRGVPGHPYEQGFDLRMVREKLTEPAKWSKSKMVFVNSMSDLFHDDVPDDYIVDIVRTMIRADWHFYQVLTKRADRMADMLQGKLALAAKMPHICWGVSVENRRQGTLRIGSLRRANVSKSFLSIEPLLEDVGQLDLRGIDWVIVGGESGPKARPMRRDWVVDIRDQCQKVGVPFFFKQWGGTRKKAAGRLLDGRTYDEHPIRSHREVPSQLDRKRIVAELSTVRSIRK